MTNLSTISTKPPEDLDRDEADKLSEERAKRIAELHRQLVAEKKHAVLVVLQGMDASGKNGAMRNVFGECMPFGLRATGFVKPTERELSHDFLWRVHQQVPAKGELVLFNRSHYEDVLIQRVHGWIDEKRVDARFRAINAFEKLLIEDNNTLILKFFLHISKDQQAEELRERIDESDKHFKHNDNDWKERERWDDYQRAYEDVIDRSEVPWHIVPVDSRWYRNYLMTEIVLNELEALNMEWPELKTEMDWKE